MRLLFATSYCLLQSSSALMADGHSSIASMLNAKIAGSTSGTYSGGHNPGVMVRTPDFLDNSDQAVVPATLWHNDIYAPSQMYPTVSSPWCPNDGWDGFYSCDSCSDGPWTFATVAVVMAGAMNNMFDDFSNIMADDWGWGVFYASDANAADQRCVYRQDDGGWDCPGGWVDMSTGEFYKTSNKGAGAYSPGNPWAKGLDKGGGGAGCHFDGNANSIDQPDANGDQGNLVQDASCQCNYGYNSDWGGWIEAWTYTTQQKTGFENRNWLNGGGLLAPAWGVDTAACWVNNPRDMIEIQNRLYWSRSSWNNQLLPKSDWSSQSTDDLRKYWGWNEIPVAKSIADDAGSWDAIIIKLPADTCQNGDWGLGDEPSCLFEDAQKQLELDLGQFVHQGKLIPGAGNIGSRPGSFILFVREFGQTYDNGGFGVNWSREFFCKSWSHGQYQVVHADDDCYLDYAGSPTPTPPTPTPTPPTPTPPHQDQCDTGTYVYCDLSGSGEQCSGGDCCSDGSLCPSTKNADVSSYPECWPKKYDCTTDARFVV